MIIPSLSLFISHAINNDFPVAKLLYKPKTEMLKHREILSRVPGTYLSLKMIWFGDCIRARTCATSRAASFLSCGGSSTKYE